jgi:nitrogen regulatory protein PII
VNLVTAVIKPHKLEEVKEALKAIDMPGMTVDEV